MKKQIRLNVDEDLGDDPTLPMDLTTFLLGDMAKGWDDAPSPSTPFSVDLPQLPPRKGPQHSTTGEANQKVLAKPSSAWSWSQSQLKGMPDPVNHPHQWIQAEMDVLGAHPHWWKEIRAINKLTMERALKRYTMREDFNKPETLYFAQW